MFNLADVGNVDNVGSLQGVQHLMQQLQGLENLLSPLITILFSLGGLFIVRHQAAQAQAKKDESLGLTQALKAYSTRQEVDNHVNSLSATATTTANPPSPSANANTPNTTKAEVLPVSSVVPNESGSSSVSLQPIPSVVDSVRNSPLDVELRSSWSS